MQPMNDDQLWFRAVELQLAASRSVVVTERRATGRRGTEKGPPESATPDRPALAGQRSD